MDIFSVIDQPGFRNTTDKNQKDTVTGLTILLMLNFFINLIHKISEILVSFYQVCHRFTSM